MDKLKRVSGIMALSLLSVLCHAQDTSGGSEDFMHSNGKIYVVVAVVVTIVIGLFLYLLNLDRKISKMEKRS